MKTANIHLKNEYTQLQITYIPMKPTFIQRKITYTRFSQVQTAYSPALSRATLKQLVHIKIVIELSCN